jgi:hypothetical protein
MSRISTKLIIKVISILKTGAVQCLSQADLGAVLLKVNMTGWRIRDKPTGSPGTMSTSLPVDARVQRKGGGGVLNGCLMAG